MGILEGLGSAASQVGGAFKGAGEVLWETGEGVATLGANALKTGYDLGPAGWLADGASALYTQATGDTLDVPDWLPSAERGGERMEAAADLVSTIARNPGLLVDAVVDPIVDDWQAGRYGEAIGRGAAELVLTVAGTKGVDKAAKGAKAADAAGDIADAARAAEHAQDLGDGGRVAARGDDAADLAEILARADTGRTVGGRPLLQFDTMDDFNVAANAARPDTVYAFGDYRWSTDEAGRVVKAEGSVSLEPAGRNDPGLQRQIGHEGYPTDVGFHLIADSFAGPTNRLNVVPGNGKPLPDGTKNLNTGAYGHQFEGQIRALKQENPELDVQIRVEPYYDAGNTTSRPDGFVAAYRQEGGKWVEFDFDNIH
ncbi:DNA/RNA non-specific endonuclease [Luteimonas sp. TWI662]|uniref:DNA/RNA non-specific endonuclease n=1 Tax=unclassified Luteimonas TaxID=2629088 RepID=UPI00320A0F7B